MKTSEKLSIIGELLDEIYAADERHYLHFDFVLSNAGCSYNVYTPTIKHNNHENFDSFKEFLISLKRSDDSSVRVKALKETLHGYLRDKNNIIKNIKEVNDELGSFEPRE